MWSKKGGSGSRRPPSSPSAGRLLTSCDDGSDAMQQRCRPAFFHLKWNGIGAGWNLLQLFTFLFLILAKCGSKCILRERSIWLQNVDLIINDFDYLKGDDIRV